MLHKTAKMDKARVQPVDDDLAIGANYNSLSQNLTNVVKILQRHEFVLDFNVDF